MRKRKGEPVGARTAALKGGWEHPGKRGGGGKKTRLCSEEKTGDRPISLKQKKGMRSNVDGSLTLPDAKREGNWEKEEQIKNAEAAREGILAPQKDLWLLVGVATERPGRKRKGGGKTDSAQRGEEECKPE